MILTVQSDKYISEDRLDKIRDIFAQSECPNESLSKTFNDFNYFRNDVIQFGNEIKYVAITPVKDKKSFV